MKIVGGNKMTEETKEHEGLRREIDELTAAAEVKDAKIEDQRNQILRLMADFDNFKKRSAIERDEIICFSNEAMIMGLLPILDNFDRAMKHVLTKDGRADDELIKGFALIKKQLEDLLFKTGLAKIECVGKEFDPFFHEAILTKEDPEGRDGIVIEEVQNGYMLKDKVIRASMVIVSKKGEKKDE